MEELGRRDWELPCICGHINKEHRHMNREADRWKYTTKVCWSKYCICFEFKLDNLAYVEQVARARGLV